jgi:hypothetical protein
MISGEIMKTITDGRSSITRSLRAIAEFTFSMTTPSPIKQVVAC